MRLLFVADGRSPIALNWITHFIEQGDEVHLVSTFASKPDPRLASYTFIPVAFSGLKSSELGAVRGRSGRSVLRGGGMSVRLRTLVRQWLGPITLAAPTSHLKSVIAEISPDLVHAMRIPYEGMLAALASGATDGRETAGGQVGQAATKAGEERPNVAKRPLLISVWGNDFTLHAPATPLMRHYTRLALQCADALHADCQRDVRLARQWGFSPSKPAVVLPGAGGVQSELFYPPPEPVAEPVVINPRGFRAYVNNAAFFQAIPKVLANHPEARFLCTTMEHEPQARRWVGELGIRDNVELLPVQTRPQMAGLFRRSRVAVSPSNHDGTPNTLLEAMACGCLPVAGDLESIREWITPGLNGLLVDPNDPDALAAAIQRALTQDDLLNQARSINAALIAERAEHRAVMQRASIFYQVLLERKDY